MNEPRRKYWFASYQGNDEDRDRMRHALHEQGFEALLFKKNEGREKGVDISLTKEMLVHAFQRNTVESILVAGDEDY
ncbi:MAG: NYN domain-containing protein [Verrucomicrobia bacterium]|nr:NYN domain-containing protein [Verrucomicrobiota bacterium]